MSSGRSDKSLTQLTERFMELLRTTPQHRVDINSVSSQLAVGKRRIYDITLVLEGVGLIVKPNKNTVALRAREEGEAAAPAAEVDLTVIRKEVKELDLLLTRLNRDTAMVRAAIKITADMVQGTQLASTSYADLRRLETLRHATRFAVKAPSGTSLSVPIPVRREKKLHYNLYLCSEAGPIEAFAIFDEPPAKAGAETGTILRLSPPPPQPAYVFDEYAAAEGAGSPAAKRAKAAAS